MVSQCKEGQLVANTMTGFGAADSLCALGRFASAQIVNASQRLTKPLLREGEDLSPADWTSALQAVADALHVFETRIHPMGATV